MLINSAPLQKRYFCLSHHKVLGRNRFISGLLHPAYVGIPKIDLLWKQEPPIQDPYRVAMCNHSLSRICDKTGKWSSSPRVITFHRKFHLRHHFHEWGKSEFFFHLCIDTWEVSGRYWAELFGQIPTARVLERKHSWHEHGALSTIPCPPTATLMTFFRGVPEISISTNYLLNYK